jgi:hypothetical protein
MTSDLNLDAIFFTKQRSYVVTNSKINNIEVINKRVTSKFLISDIVTTNDLNLEKRKTNIYKFPSVKFHNVNVGFPSVKLLKVNKR